MAESSDTDPDRFLYSRHYDGNSPEYTNDFLTLAKLLTPPKAADAENSQGDCLKKVVPGLSPGLIGPPKVQPAAVITDPLDELESAFLDDQDCGFYQEPKYDIVYKQGVNAEDLFLGFSNKNPSTASCETLLVKIWLPDTQVADIDLDVQPQFLKCRTEKYKLHLPLPHPVDPTYSEGAKFTDGLLSVSLKLNREYEFLNH